MLLLDLAPTLIAVGLVLTVVAVPIVTTRRAWHRWGERMKLLKEQQLHILQLSLGA